MDHESNAMGRAAATWRALLTIVLWCGAAGAQAQDVRVVLPGGADAYLPVAPGAETVLAFEVRNGGTTVAEGSMGGQLDVPAAVVAAYAMVPDDPARCGAPTLLPAPLGTRLAFPLAGIPPGGTLSCRYAVRRAAGASDDLGFAACWSGGPLPFVLCAGRVRVGTLLDTALRVEPLPAAADGTTLVRLHLDNASALAIQARTATTPCLEFEGGLFAPTSFDLDGAVAGGCASAPLGLCANFTGQAFDNRAFLLGPTSIGAGASCLMRIRPTGRQGRRTTTLGWSDDRIVLADGTIRFDPRRDNDTVVIGLGIGQPSPIPVGQATPVATAILLLILGALALRARPARA